MDFSTHLSAVGPRSFLIGLLVSILLTSPVNALAAAAEDQTDLVDMSLEELLNMEITTLSRKAEDLMDAPAAVFVISQSDIQGSGARSIPDLLRMVPGMQVAQIDNNKWAVTARGANGRFANKLLVLMDGRSVYSPLLSGVYWDVQDTDLATIERIEVIRGPGATMWGANAVNGVVNIITKSAVETQGSAVRLMASDTSDTEASFRYGGETSNLAYRVYGKAFDYDGNVDMSGQKTDDSWESTRIGGRVDWLRSDDVELTLTSEAYTGKSGDTGFRRTTVPPYQTIEASVGDVSGAFAQFRWFDPGENGDSLQFLTYFVHEERDGRTLQEQRDTLDIDMQHRLGNSDKHDLMWGLGFRHSSDRTIGSFEIEMSREKVNQQIFSAFVQDDIAISDRFRVILGSKIESNSFSNRSIELEPSVRFSWRIDDSQSLWASASRAVRTPARGELDGTVVSAVVPPGMPPFSLPLPVAVTVSSDGGLESEEIHAYEVGYRFRTDDVFLDIALFYNDYDKLRSIRPGDTTCQPGGEIVALDPACLAISAYVESALILENGSFKESYGAEVWMSAEINDSWSVQTAYTYYQSGGPSTSPLTLTFAEDSPEHQVSIRSSMDLPADLHLDLWGRYVDKLESQQLDAYTAIDIRLGWNPVDSFEVAAAGRNLIAGKHVEFVSELGDLVPIQIEPQAYIELRWNF